MSRVRILNLPNDCTEEQLKQHLIRTAPADAPLLEITDVQFIRRAANAKDRAHQRQHQQQKRGGLGGGNSAKASSSSSASSLHGSSGLSKRILRMAFVGFRTSAAGHFVAQYFNNSYFRSARLKVELAKGLNEVGVTLNQQRKKEVEEKKKLARENWRKAAADAGAATERDTEKARKRPRAEGDKREEADEDVPANANAGSSSSSAGKEDTTGLARRQREFVEMRSKATEGPTWASEVLLAPDPAVPAASLQAEGTEQSGGDFSDPKSASKKSKTDRHAAVDVPLSSTAAAADLHNNAEVERQALERQQELGAVSDMDFLAGLAGEDRSSRRPTTETHMPSSAEDGPEVAEDDEEVAERRHHPTTHEDATTLADADNGEEKAEAMPRHRTSKSEGNATAAAPASSEAQEDIARVSQRIRLGNIPYIATEEHIKQFASSLVGPVDAVHIPLTKDTRQNKGAAFVKFVSADDAVRALQLCRGAILMGRLLRVSAAEEDPHSKRVLEREAALASTAATAHAGGSGGTTESLPGSSQFKKQREAARRQEGTTGGGSQDGAGQVTWNTMYMNSHAAVETVAQRLGVRSEDVVGVAAKGAAVRAAIAEAYLTSEVQQVLSDEGIAFDLLMEASQNFLKARSNTTILVKNLQLKDGNDAAALTKLFVRFGVLETSAFPSAGTFALFRFTHSQDARIAFTRLSYKLHNNAPLFLEWAPVGALTEDGEGGRDAAAAAADLGLVGASGASNKENDGEGGVHEASGPSSAAYAVVYTFFLTNVPFQTTEEELHAFMLDACPRLARSPDVLLRRLVLQQEQGRAFVTVADASTLAYCVAKLNGKTLSGRTLSCVVSKQTTQMQAARAEAAVGGSGEASASGLAKRGPHGNRGGVANAADDDDEDPTKTAVIARRRGGTTGEEEDARHASSSPSSKVPPGNDPLKLIVKNLPFEATEKDVRELFGAFSEIRTVRVPRKSNTFSSHRENNHRGFAFVEFLSEAEAARALETLKATHLYGRHLVLQYAKLDA